MPNWWGVAWSASEWAAFGAVLAAFASIVLAIGAVATAAQAVYLYKASKRIEAAHWLQEMFEQFYLSDNFLASRTLLQYEYLDKVAPLIERRLTDRDVPRTSEQTVILNEVDKLLNYFEWILYLEQNDHLDKDDRMALFRYWFDLMKDPEKGALRRYCATWDWERLNEEVVVENAGGSDGNRRRAPQEDEYIAVYGSLMSGLALADAPRISDYLERVGPCKIKGRLFDLGDYPGLVEGAGTVEGELYRLKFPLSDARAVEAFRMLDKYERYDAHKARESLYVRHIVRLQEPADLDAWVYIYNRPIQDRAQVESGDWRKYRLKNSSG